MTNDEAIKILNQLHNYDLKDYQAVAIDMAIKALGSWDKYSDELWKKAYKRGYDDRVDAYRKIRRILSQNRILTDRYGEVVMWDDIKRVFKEVNADADCD